MERMTTDREGGGSLLRAEALTPCEGGFCGPAADRLAGFERFAAELAANQEKYAAELERLRAAGKTKSVQFREAFGRKTVDADILIRLKYHGIE